MAPPGFLAVEKIAVTLLGNSEYALRLFPLACGILSLVLLWRLANRLVQGAAVPAAVALMALAPGLIYYSCVAKQYSSDVTASLVLLLLALDLRQGAPTARQAWRAGVAGAVIVWFSQPAVLTVAGIGVTLAALAVLERNTNALRRIALVAGLWGASAAGAVLAAQRLISSRHAQLARVYWKDGFPPFPLEPPTAVHWLWDRTTLSVFDVQGFAYYESALYVILAAIGFAGLLRKRRDYGALLFAPGFVAIAAAVARQYPFEGRLTLFLEPSLVLVIVAGASALGALATKHRAIVSGLVATLIVVPAAQALARVPPIYDRERFTPALAHLAVARREGDQVYVYYGSAQAFLYYAPRFGFGTHDYVIGGCHRGDTDAYLKELDHFRGSPRLWVVIAHGYPHLEVEAISGYLKQIGVSRDSLVLQTRGKYGFPTLGSRVDLYDLSDANRLGAVREESTGPQPEPSLPVAFGCQHGPPATAQDSLAGR